MNDRKTSSTNYQNEQELIRECPMTFTYTLLGKRWKPIILWKLNEDCNHSASLLKEIPLISRKMLFQELQELEERGLIEVSGNSGQKRYALSELGLSLLPLLQQMWDWGETHRNL